ncbi:hypothetical protein F5144DRAFT_325829 [Chaetomium tenue]|uniref:Uncharacterized protein n=1 Tax=Chaetomium tenue TaxID=1854479 RepID=A0ACB7P6I9_9PEZI|nr:hypothetical protein F5144DRAFT_325829 [Chaetomium globosum]
MGSPHKVSSIRPRLRRDPTRFVFGARSLTKTIYFERLMLFIETRLQTLPCRHLRQSNRGLYLALSGLPGGELHVASHLVPDPVAVSRRRRRPGRGRGDWRSPSPPLSRSDPAQRQRRRQTHRRGNSCADPSLQPRPDSPPGTGPGLMPPFCSGCTAPSRMLFLWQRQGSLIKLNWGPTECSLDRNMADLDRGMVASCCSRG